MTTTVTRNETDDIQFDYVAPDTVQIREIVLGAPGRATVILDFDDEANKAVVTIAGVDPESVNGFMQGVSELLGALKVDVHAA